MIKKTKINKINTKVVGVPLLLSFIAATLIGCVQKSDLVTNNLATQKLQQAFKAPPQSAKPGVYWYFMDGNQDQAQMTKDLESMASVGLSKVVFLEVNIGVPRGPVDFMSEQWQENFAHAVKTAERLNMEVILGTGPGWAGSGGPWVKPEQSMQHLVANTTNVQGPVLFKQKLAVPKPPEPNSFAGMNEHWEQVRDDWYQDVTVLAYPTPETPATFEQKDLKTLKETKPYSLWKTTPRYIDSNANYDEPATENVIDPSKIIELKGKMAKDGTLEWQVPTGKWTIMRLVSRATGQTTRPAPTPGHGFDTDKFNPQAFLDHWDNFQGKLMEKVKPSDNGKGWTRIHLDSWEMSSQNWSQNFEQAFIKRRGYDPKPYYPAYAGFVVESLEKTERFLWDLRQTAKDLVIDNYAKVIKEKAHSNGMLYSNQPYDMNPAGDLDLGAVADIPSCEFWDYRNGEFIDSLYSCIEATSIAHTTGKKVIPVEAFTSAVPVRFHAYPGQMKNQTDWALAFGVTNFIYHTFQHQPLGEDYLPGMSMGPHGTNWHRNQNWWDMLPAYHSYVSRGSYLLQQGVSVADIVYLAPEGVPHIFWPPNDAIIGEGLIKDKRGYSFDAVSANILAERGSVNTDGRIQFKDASAYKVLVLPDVNTMTPETLTNIISLVEAGATVIGNPPNQSPSLMNYPQADQQLAQLVKKLWGSEQLPKQLSQRSIGKGQIFWGENLYQKQDNSSVKEVLYPAYENTARLLSSLGLTPDFVELYPENNQAFPDDVSVSNKLGDEQNLRFIHRAVNDASDVKHIYFLANRTKESIKTLGQFRVSSETSGLVPYLWDPETGNERQLAAFKEKADVTQIPLRFNAHQSYFIVFRTPSNKDKQSTAKALTFAANFPQATSVMTIDQPWKVSFDTQRGGPANITFDRLLDWREHENTGIKYYSGKAVYRTHFDLPSSSNVADTQYLIDLGLAYEMARVTINGVDQGVAWTSPWQLEISTPLKATGNVLEIEVANSWENRLIGDSMPADKDAREVSWPSGLLEGKTYKAGRYTFTTYLEKAEDFGDVEQLPWELQPSGLIGPVKLLRQQ